MLYHIQGAICRRGSTPPGNLGTPPANVVRKVCRGRVLTPARSNLADFFIPKFFCHFI